MGLFNIENLVSSFDYVHIFFGYAAAFPTNSWRRKKFPNLKSLEYRFGFSKLSQTFIYEPQKCGKILSNNLVLSKIPLNQKID